LPEHVRCTCLRWVRFDLDVGAACVRRSAEPRRLWCARVRL